MTDFERRVEHYLEYSGWKKVYGGILGGAPWAHAEYLEGSSTEAALWKQLKRDFEQHGDIERAAEILERSKG